MRQILERPPTTPPGPSGLRPGALSFMVDKRDHPARLEVAGEIDLATSDSLVDAVHDAMTADVQLLEIDVSAVTFWGSTGISALLRLRRTAHDEGKEVLLVNLNSWIERVLTITGLLEQLTGPPPQEVTRRHHPNRIDLRSHEPVGGQGAWGNGGSR